MKKPCGVMVLSLDLELSWGRFDKLQISELEAQSIEERTNIKRLLALLDRYEIPATWAMVGHLMLDGCSRDLKGQVHSEVTPHARYSWLPHEWFKFDPCSAAEHAPAWYAPDIIDWIRGGRVQHEIGSHSFAHIYFGDPECTPAVANADLQAALDAAALKGVALRSFVFPRNQVGHLSLLRQFGFHTYRGATPELMPGSKGTMRRLVNWLDQLLARIPQPVQAEEIIPGLWNIPGNHFFMARDGIRKYIPMSSRVLKGIKGIDQAVQTGQLYHLWFHPFNLNADANAMFSGLERILSYASQMRNEGLLQILTMDEYGQQLMKGREISAVPMMT